MREASLERNTLETQISLSINVDGIGNARISTNIGFLDHMLELFAKHSKIDITLKCTGDLHVDHHHTVEDIGIALGLAIKKAVNDKKSIKRYGNMLLPMDETLALVACDFSGRAFLACDMPDGQAGGVEIQMFEEFFRALAFNAEITLHIKIFYGVNGHHITEAIFKACGRAFREALEHDPREEGIPSTKGAL